MTWANAKKVQQVLWQETGSGTRRNFLNAQGPTSIPYTLPSPYYFTTHLVGEDHFDNSPAFFRCRNRWLRPGRSIDFESTSPTDYSILLRTRSTLCYLLQTPVVAVCPTTVITGLVYLRFLYRPPLVQTRPLLSLRITCHESRHSTCRNNTRF